MALIAASLKYRGHCGGDNVGLGIVSLTPPSPPGMSVPVSASSEKNSALRKVFNRNDTVFIPDLLLHGSSSPRPSPLPLQPSRLSLSLSLLVSVSRDGKLGITM